MRSLYNRIMGDSGEGLIDNEARIQERMEELQQNRVQSRKPPVQNVQLLQQIESLQLARREMARSLENTRHESAQGTAQDGPRGPRSPHQRIAGAVRIIIPCPRFPLKLFCVVATS